MKDDSIEILKQMLDIMKNSHFQQKEILSVEEAAQYLDISVGYLYKLTSQRLIKHYKPLSKKIYFKRSELLEFVLSEAVPARDEFLERGFVAIQRKC